MIRLSDNFLNILVGRFTCINTTWEFDKEETSEWTEWIRFSIVDHVEFDWFQHITIGTKLFFTIWCIGKHPLQTVLALLRTENLHIFTTFRRWFHDLLTMFAHLNRIQIIGHAFRWTKETKLILNIFCVHKQTGNGNRALACPTSTSNIGLDHVVDAKCTAKFHHVPPEKWFGHRDRWTTTIASVHATGFTLLEYFVRLNRCQGLDFASSCKLNGKISIFKNLTFSLSMNLYELLT